METATSESKSLQTGLQHLENIEQELEEIKERTGNPTRSLFIGILQGAGAIVGSVIALVVLGWLLSLVGVIPGVGALANSLHSVVDRFNARY